MRKIIFLRKKVTSSKGRAHILGPEAPADLSSECSAGRGCGLGTLISLLPGSLPRAAQLPSPGGMMRRGVQASSLPASADHVGADVGCGQLPQSSPSERAKASHVCAGSGQGVGAVAPTVEPSGHPPFVMPGSRAGRVLSTPGARGDMSAKEFPGTQRVPLLEMWLPRTWTSIQSFQVNLWPHWPAWAAGHCWGPGCFFECLSRALPCLTTPLCCMWTRPPHLSHHSASDRCRQTQATSKAACLQVLVGSHTLSLGDK